jgi:hypothetical protein
MSDTSDDMEILSCLYELYLEEQEERHQKQQQEYDMADKEKKYLTIGSVTEFDGKEQIQLDNGSLKEFLDYLRDHGKKYLEAKSLEEIRAGQKLKSDVEGHIPRLRLYFFTPNDKAPKFIKANVAIKLR